MKSEPIYRSIAVASTFSPRFIQVLAEAKRIRDRFDATLSLIYVGQCNEETTRKFGNALTQLALPADSKIYYQEGEPAAAILRAAADNNIDLIVAGALEKQVILRPFLGNVARRLVRDTDCSVMLFIHPEHEPKRMKKMVFVADYSEHGERAFRMVLHLAQRERCECLYAIRVYTTFDEARASRRAKAPDPQAPARTLAEEEAAWSNSFSRQARPMFRSKRAVCVEIPPMPPLILCRRSRRICSQFRCCRRQERKKICRRKSRGSPM